MPAMINRNPASRPKRVSARRGPPDAENRADPPSLWVWITISSGEYYVSTLPKQNQSPLKRLILGNEEDLLEAFLEHIPDGLADFKDRESRFVRVSRSLANRFGLGNPAEAIHKSDFDMFDDEHAKQAFADEQEIIRTGQPIVEKEEKETWPDGHQSWVLTTKLPLLNQQGKIIGTMGISRDITDRKRVELELQEHRVRLEELVAVRTAELMRARTPCSNRTSLPARLPSRTS